MGLPWLRYLGKAALVFGAYFVTARLGLGLDAVAGFATLVWPPTGISLAALFLLGDSLWPAVALGAFAVNLAAGAPLAVACGIAAGNTLEALAGAKLLRLARFQPGLERVRDVLALALLAASLSTLVSALIGVGSLWAGGVVHGSGALAAMRAWWVGDALGDLVIAPALFVWTARPPLSFGRWRWLEALAVAALLVGLSLAIFGGPGDGLLRQTYILFPALVLAASRFGPYGASTGVLLVTAIAIAGTALGHGPFLRASLSESLLFLQMFMGTVALTMLVVEAAMTERNRAVEARDEFLAIASHELSTPLTAVSLQVQNLLRALKSGHVETEKLRAHMEATWRMVGRLARMMRELLEISRISGRIRLEREEVDLALLIRESVSRLDPQIVQAGSAVTVLASEPVPGQWDRTRLDQVIDNLLTNAIKFGAGKPVEIVVDGVGSMARLEVRDHGIGIGLGDQARVFERFERAVSRRRFGGLGLGLWIARQVVEAHGGTISLSSELGRGSTFTVQLPRALATG
jgi:signal transduction histidine kinase